MKLDSRPQITKRTEDTPHVSLKRSVHLNYLYQYFLNNLQWYLAIQIVLLFCGCCLYLITANAKTTYQ